MPLSEEGDTQSSLCLEWKQLNFSVPAQEQSNYSFWNECRKQSEVRILHDGKFLSRPLPLSMWNVGNHVALAQSIVVSIIHCSQRPSENGRPHRHLGRLGGGQDHIAGCDFATTAR